MQTFSIIAAMSKNRAIGKDGKIPWHLPADLRRFKALTLGHAVIMGRRTWESLPRKPLPQRRNIVISSMLQDGDGMEVVRSLDEALERAWETDDNPFVIGGSFIYSLALRHRSASRMYLTRLTSYVAGDVFFPIDGMMPWEMVGRYGVSEDGAWISDRRVEPYMYFEEWVK